MFRKTRLLAAGVTVAGVLGFAAPMASAATFIPGNSGGNSGGLVNLSNNQIPVQVCGNDVPVNALGVQVPVDTPLSAVLGLLSPGLVSSSSSSSNRSCGLANGQS